MNLTELLKIAEAATQGESDCQQAFAKLRMMDFYSAFNPSAAIELIKRVQEAEKDANRYRLLRQQQWHSSEFFVVKTHHSKIQLGTDCPILDRLDDLIDKALKGE